MNPITRHILVSAVALSLAAVTAGAETLAENPRTPAPKHEQQAPVVERHLRKFDTLDFNVFSHQKWERLVVVGQ
jgi:hypothetical protein